MGGVVFGEQETLGKIGQQFKDITQWRTELRDMAPGSGSRSHARCPRGALDGAPRAARAGIDPPSAVHADACAAGFLSLMFTAMCDIAIDALTDATTIKLVREFLREEHPEPSGDTPSPRGSRCRPRRAGCDAGADTGLPSDRRDGRGGDRDAGAQRDAAADMSDVKVLTILRLWGAISVSVEYGEYWTRMDTQFACAGGGASRRAPAPRRS
jgi:hypothetical protein